MSGLFMRYAQGSSVSRWTEQSVTGGLISGWLRVDVIWRNTVEYQPPRAIFPQGRAWCAKFGATPSGCAPSPIPKSN
jgi:hypothetical protein